MENLEGQLSIDDALADEAHRQAAAEFRVMRERLLRDLLIERGMDPQTASGAAQRALATRTPSF